MVSVIENINYLGRRVRGETGEFLGRVKRIRRGRDPEKFWLVISPSSIFWIPGVLAGVAAPMGCPLRP